MDHQTIEEQVRQRLIAIGAGQLAISKATGIAQSTVGRFLRGENNPNIKTFYALVRFVQDHEAMAILVPKKSATGRKTHYEETATDAG